MPDSVFVPTRENNNYLFLTNGGSFQLFRGEGHHYDKEEDSTFVYKGKYSTCGRIHRSGDYYYVFTDGLCNKENHTYTPNLLKVFGLTADITRWETNVVFRSNGVERLGIDNFIYATCNRDIVGRGKAFRCITDNPHPVKCNEYIEVYPVDITFLTVEEYKELRKEKDKELEFRIPDTVLPEIEFATELKKRLASSD